MTSVHTSPRSHEGTTWRAALQAGAFPLLGGLAGIGAALVGLLGCLAVAVVGWFLADAGAHGDTRDAMRVGADAWLLGHGSGLDLGGVRYSVVPLGLTLLLALVVHRTARAAVRTLPPVDDREAGLGIGLLVIGYASTSVVVAVLAGTDAARVPMERAVIGAVVMAGVVGGASVLRECDRWSLVTDRLPGGSEGPAPVVVAAALRTAGWAVLAGLVLVVGSLVAHASTVWAMLSASVPSGGGSGTGSATGDMVAVGLVALLVLPNAALFGVGYLVGPGFAVGSGTTVSATAVSLGPVPVFPLLGALPTPGREPWFVMLVWAVPPVVAAAAVIRTARRDPGTAVDWRLGGLAGVLGGALLGVLSGLGGGALGDGRMAEVGTSVVQVALFGAVSCGLGGVVGGLLARLVNHLLDRQRVDREARAAAALDSAGDEVPTSSTVAERVRRHRESVAGRGSHEHTRHQPAEGREPVPPRGSASSAGVRDAAEEDTLSGRELLAAFIGQTDQPTSVEPTSDRRATVGTVDTSPRPGGWEQGWTEWAGEAEWSDAHDEDTAPIVRRPRA